MSSADRKTCAQKHCGQIRFLIPNVTKEIVMSGCRRCTECLVNKQKIVQSWWYFYYDNGTRSPDQTGNAAGGTDYSIDVRTCVAHMHIELATFPGPIPKIWNGLGMRLRLNMHACKSTPIVTIRTLLLMIGTSLVPHDLTLPPTHNIYP